MSFDSGPAAGTAAPSPQCLHDGGRFSSTAQDARARTANGEGEPHQALRPRMRAIAALIAFPSIDFDSRRLHHLSFVLPGF